MSSWEDQLAIILDNGSAYLKAGFAGDDAPRAVVPSVVGRSRHDPTDVSVGDDALSRRGVTLRYPVEHGVVVHWDDMERVWRRCYAELNVDPSQHAALITEAPLNPKANREKTAEIFFESLRVPALHLQIQAVLALYSGGRTEGMVVDSGDGVTHAVPVYDGHATPSAVRRMDIAGRDVTEWIMQLLSDETDRPFTTSSDRELARQFKEKHCYVAEDFTAERAALESGAKPPAVFDLPDGQKLTVGLTRIGGPEIIFDPSVAEKSADGLPQVVMSSLQECGVDIRRPLMHNIVLSGGTTMFEGFGERLRKEVAALVAPRARDDVRVVSLAERKYSVWMGAAILGSLQTFSTEWVTKHDWDESGPAALHRRCDALSFVEK
jgi:actin